MKKIESFTNRYSLSKTLRFRAIPVGDTQKNFELNHMLEKDKQRAEYYAKAKSLIDKYHRHYIEGIFSNIKSAEGFDSFLSEHRGYADLYESRERDKNALENSEAAMRKFLADALKAGENYKSLGKKEMIQEILPAYLDSIGDEEGKAVIAEFANFSTYFTGFFTNRANMYSAEEKSTAISYRCINDNLPKFLDNRKVFTKFELTDTLADQWKQLNEEFQGVYGTVAEDVFSVDYFPFVLAQTGIEQYNAVIGGYTKPDGTKVQGLNEYINLHNQQIDKKDKETKRIPKLKLLYKQILSDQQSLSFIPEAFKSDDEVLGAIKAFYDAREDGKIDSISETLDRIKELFLALPSFDQNGLFVKNDLALTTVCNGAFGYWGTVESAWNDEYDETHRFKATEKYTDARKKAYKSTGSFSLAAIQHYAEQKPTDKKDVKTVCEWFQAEIAQKCAAVSDAYTAAKNLLEQPYTAPKKLCANDAAIETIKNALDSLKDLERVMKLLLGTGKEADKDESFYGEFFVRYERLRELDRLYDRVRNYMTQKPYNTEKIKLNFDNPQFLGGWDRNKESDYSAVMLQKDGRYYVAVMAAGSKKSFESIPLVKDGEAVYEKVIYKLLPGPNKMLPKVFFSQKGIKTFNPPKEILEKYARGTHKTGDSFNLEDCHNLIDYFKSAISIHPDWSQFGFEFSDTSSYRNIGEFYNEVKNQGYSISFCHVPVSYVDKLVQEGKLYLFQLYNKDFSSHSKGTPNLHTLYFKMLFDERNLADVVFKLNGESEMFYREASISRAEQIVHPKDQPIPNKNEHNKKKQSTFAYYVVKDRRYTVDQFMIHIPITLNFTASGSDNINLDVRRALKDCDDNYVIGIDRGERNLLYISVIDSKGRIVEQYSLNEIVNEHHGLTHKTDYHALLDQKEKERLEARTNWKAVENIKELKEGYISQVVHKICQLVEKYDAIIVMEDLNFGFKRVRGGKFEKSVYQKFEKMLIDKLNYYADKKKQPAELGGVLNAYQLTNKFDSFKKMGKQNGFIFYVPAYLTSKIDPTTGFADFLHPRYESIAASQRLVGAFDRIAYNEAENYFEFDLDYGKFEKCAYYGQKKWTVCTFGRRIETFRNEEKNSEWDNREIDLTEAFKALFSAYGVDWRAGLQAQLLAQTEKEFWVRLIRLIALTLQLRNSETGNAEKDYLISPVRNAAGQFYNSDDYKGVEKSPLPIDADANGAYNIARKGLWVIEQFKKCGTDEDLFKTDLAIKNAEWLDYVQNA